MEFSAGVGKTLFSARGERAVGFGQEPFAGPRINREYAGLSAPLSRRRKVVELSAQTFFIFWSPSPREFFTGRGPG